MAGGLSIVCIVVVCVILLIVWLFNQDDDTKEDDDDSTITSTRSNSGGSSTSTTASGYIIYTGYDQDDQTIKPYSNAVIGQCETDCTSDSTCFGYGMRNDLSQCWTMRGMPSPYSNSDNTLYTKPGNECTLCTGTRAPCDNPKQMENSYPSGKNLIGGLCKPPGGGLPHQWTLPNQNCPTGTKEAAPLVHVTPQAPQAPLKNRVVCPGAT